MYLVRLMARPIRACACPSGPFVRPVGHLEAGDGKTVLACMEEWAVGRSGCGCRRRKRLDRHRAPPLVPPNAGDFGQPTPRWHVGTYRRCPPTPSPLPASVGTAGLSNWSASLRQFLRFRRWRCANFFDV